MPVLCTQWHSLCLQPRLMVIYEYDGAWISISRFINPKSRPPVLLSIIFVVFFSVHLLLCLIFYLYITSFSRHCSFTRFYHHHVSLVQRPVPSWRAPQAGCTHKICPGSSSSLQPRYHPPHRRCPHDPSFSPSRVQHSIVPA